MKRFEERRKMRRKLYSKPVVLGLFILALILSRAVWYSYRGRQIASANLNIAKNEKVEVDERISSLESEINRLATERGKEEAIRSKLGMVKEGEGVVVLVEPEKESVIAERDKVSLWERVMGLFR